MPNSLPLQSPTLGADGRVVGLDVHPDTFAGAILQGRDPLTAKVTQRVTGQSLALLEAWAARHTTAEDLLVLEASSNSFSIVVRLLSSE